MSAFTARALGEAPPATDIWSEWVEGGLSDESDHESILRTLDALCSEENEASLGDIFWDLLPALIPLAASEEGAVVDGARRVGQLVADTANAREVPLAALSNLEDCTVPEQFSLALGVAGRALARLESTELRAKISPDIVEYVRQSLDLIEPKERAHEAIFAFVFPLLPVVTQEGPSQLPLFASLVGLGLLSLAARCHAPGFGQTGFLTREILFEPVAGTDERQEGSLPSEDFVGSTPGPCPLTRIFLVHPYLGLEALLRQQRRKAFSEWMRQSSGYRVKSPSRLDLLTTDGPIPWSMVGIAEIAGSCVDIAQEAAWLPRTLSAQERFNLLITPAVLLLPREGASMNAHSLLHGLSLLVSATSSLPRSQMSESTNVNSVYLLRHRFTRKLSQAPEWIDALPDAEEVVSALLSGLMMCLSESLRRKGLDALMRVMAVVPPQDRLNLLKHSIVEFPVPNARAVLADVLRAQISDATVQHIQGISIDKSFISPDIGFLLVSQIEDYGCGNKKDDTMLHRDSDAGCALLSALKYCLAVTAPGGIAAEHRGLYGLRNNVSLMQKAKEAVEGLRRNIVRACKNWEYEMHAPDPKPPTKGPQHFGKPIRPPQDVFRINLLDNAAETVLELLS